MLFVMLVLVKQKKEKEMKKKSCGHGKNHEKMEGKKERMMEYGPKGAKKKAAVKKMAKRMKKK